MIPVVLSVLLANAPDSIPSVPSRLDSSANLDGLGSTPPADSPIGVGIHPGSPVGTIVAEPPIATDSVVPGPPIAEDSTNLGGVRHFATTTIRGRSALKKLRESPMEVEPIDLQKDKERPTDLVRTLNRVPGVSIRQDGGAGSGARININGLQGKAVRFFRDGIPMEDAGWSGVLSTLSPTVLDRIEVYKGALPVHLGADALGGAVNLVSRSPRGVEAEGELEIGSFGTRKLSLRGAYGAPWGGYVRASVAGMRSDNDYTMQEVPYTDKETSKELKGSFDRFHDGFASGVFDLQAGLAGLPWIDDLRAGLQWSGQEREYQHGLNPVLVFGEVEGVQTRIAPSLRYKVSALEGRLRLDAYAEWSRFEDNILDSASRKYSWDGTYVAVGGDGGETNSVTKADIDREIERTLDKVVLEGNPWEGATLTLVQQWTGIHHQGSNPLGSKNLRTGVDPLTIPVDYEKTFLGAGFSQSLLDGRVVGEVSWKRYGIAWEGGALSDWDEDGYTDPVDESYHGGSGGLRLKPFSWLGVRSSYEWAIRMPDQEELLGDGIFVVPSLDLKPERSGNWNAGFDASWGQDTGRFFGLEANWFLRRTFDLIVTRPLGLVNAVHENLEESEAWGMELSARGAPHRVVGLGASATLLELRQTGMTKPGESWRNGARVANVPFFFGDLSASARLPAGRLPIRPELYWSGKYIHQFYLRTIAESKEPEWFWQEADVLADDVVPSQWSHDLGVSIPSRDERWSLAFELRNAFDAALYDNLGLQKPGRSLHGKVGFRL